MSRVGQVLSAVLWVAAVVHAQAPAPKPGSIKLTVIDSITRLPVAGAKVTLFDNATRKRSDLPTDAVGEVEFAGLAPGRYAILSIAAPKYIYAPGTFPSATIGPAERFNLGAIPIDPLGAISGTVIDSDGKAVARAEVHALLLTSPSSLLGSTVYTNDEGKYRLDGLQPGRFLVRVAANSQLGIPATYYPNADVVAQAVRVNVASGRESERINLTVRRMPALHIRGNVEGVSDPSKFMVFPLLCSSGGPKEIFVRTAGVSVRADSSFDIAVFPGEHCLVIRQSGGETAYFARTAVRVTNRDVDNIRIVPAALQELIGTVKLQEGAELSMPPSVGLLPTINVPQAQAFVQPDGSFRLTGVFPVDYGLFMTDGGGYIKSVKLGGVEMKDGHVNMESGGSPLVIEIAPARGRAKVKVNLGSAKPGQTLVVLMPTGSAGLRSDLMKIAPASEEGELTLERIAPGLYKAYAFADPDPALVKMPEFLELFQGTTVQIADNEELSIELRLISRREFDEAKGRF